MPTPEILDVEALLAPIPGDNPAGMSLRFAVGETLKYAGGDYDEISKLRPQKDNDAFVAGGQAGQWPQIEKLATRKLRERSKDLKLASWLIEAVVHEHGFAGLRDVVKLIRGLLDRYWDGVYPLVDDGDLEVRVAPLQPLFERNAAAWLKEIPLAKAAIPNEEGGEPISASYNLWHSVFTARSPDHIHLQGALEKATVDSPNDFFLRLKDDIGQAETELTTLRDLMAEKFKDVAPGVTTVADSLRSCKGRVVSILTARGVVGVSADEKGASGEADGSNHSTSAGGSAGGPLRTREDAAQRLREVAEFFRRTEPHSPVPYLIQRAISWSQMSFEQLLGELVKDDSSRQAINSTLGIRDGSDAAYAASGNGESDNG